MPTAATDGRNLFVNPEWYGKLTLDQKVGLVAHEMCHKIFLHCTRRGSRDPQLWNEACDHAVNTLLKKNGMTLPDGGACDMKYEGWLVETIYKDLVQEQKDNPKRQGLGQEFMDIKESDMTPEEKERYEVEVKALVERAVANAKAMGRLPAGIDAGIVECFKAPKEAWYNTLHRYMQSLSSSEYNWARLNRRTLRSHGTFSPLHLSEALGDIVLLIDTSGSCYDKAQQSNFCGHLNAILAEARPHKVHVYYFDTRVYPGETIEAGEFDISLRPKGGGGTDFRNLFTAVEEDGVYPEVAIVLTDLCGPFGDEPGYPVVWASTEDGQAPFGETIYVE
jgi:predicted metal-dependent peptidase